MFANSPNVAILAAAGSRKTQEVIETALGIEGRVLITTFTDENRAQIVRRIEQEVGVVPPNIDILGWYSFLIQHGAKPYQSALLGGQTFMLRGLNFDGEPPMFTKEANIEQYFVDGSGNLYRRHLARFVDLADSTSDGAVMRRLGRIYEAVLVDEVQDLVGWDLNVLDRLIGADLNLLLVGDPRQFTYSTSPTTKNKQYRGVGMINWLAERGAVCEVLDRVESYRCHQAICDFADGIFPDLAATKSVGVDDTGHDGIHTIDSEAVAAYVEEHAPTVLRYSKQADTLGLDAMNIGVAKGSTFDRVLIFPTKSMKDYVRSGDLKHLKTRESLYVAVTRARFSVAFVIDAD